MGLMIHLKDGGSVVEDSSRRRATTLFPRIFARIVRSSQKRCSTYKGVEVYVLPGMINRLNSEELKDLIAYLVAGGDPTTLYTQVKKGSMLQYRFVNGEMNSEW